MRMVGVTQDLRTRRFYLPLPKLDLATSESSIRGGRVIDRSIPRISTLIQQSGFLL